MQALINLTLLQQLHVGRLTYSIYQYVYASDDGKINTVAGCFMYLFSRITNPYGATIRHPWLAILDWFNRRYRSWSAAVRTCSTNIVCYIPKTRSLSIHFWINSKCHFSKVIFYPQVFLIFRPQNWISRTHHMINMLYRP